MLWNQQFHLPVPIIMFRDHTLGQTDIMEAWEMTHYLVKVVSDKICGLLAAWPSKQQYERNNA